MICMFSLTVFAGVNDIKSNTSAGRLAQVSDGYTPTITNPSYQTTDTGGDWTPKLKLDNSSGNLTPLVTGAPKITLNNASGTLTSAVTGTPNISLNNAYGSISGTSGTNSTISSALSSSTLGAWKPINKSQYYSSGLKMARTSENLSSISVCASKYIGYALQYERFYSVYSENNEGKTTGSYTTSEIKYYKCVAL